MSEELPHILLFGLPRSGTTWVGKVFDSHPETLYRHEPDSFGTLDAMPLLPDVGETERYRAVIERFAAALRDSRSPRITGKLPVFPKVYYSPARLQMRRLLLLSGKAAARAGIELPIPNLIGADARRPIHLVWKSIESLGRLGVLAHVLEGCRTVHILRHPCGYVASVLRGEQVGALGGTTAASEDYGMLELLLATEQARQRGLTLDAFRVMDPVERLAWRWVLFNEKAIADNASLPGYTCVRYEDLCRAPEDEYQRLFAFTGLSWHPQTERFIAESTATDSEAYYGLFRDPRRTAESWKHSLTSDQIARILRVVDGTPPGASYREAA